MIIAVCLNPALDITHHVPAVDWSGVNRPTAVHTGPGGKGVNVARTLHALGAPVLLLGLAGGGAGSAIETALRDLGIRPGIAAGPAIVKPNRDELAALIAGADQDSGYLGSPEHAQLSTITPPRAWTAPASDIADSPASKVAAGAASLRMAGAPMRWWSRWAPTACSRTRRTAPGRPGPPKR